jgi:predicted dehydrogenase
VSPRIGLIGCGRWGRFILRDLLSLGAKVQVTCLSDSTAAEARRAGAHAAGTGLPAIDAADAYVVATPSATHAAVLDKLVKRGRPIFVEKPMTADLESARRLAEEAPSTLFVMDKWRYHPAIVEMGRQAASGVLGDVVAITTSRWQWSSPHRDVTPLWILAPHDLSICLHVLGRIPPLRQAFAVVPGRPDLGMIAVLADEGAQVTLDIGVASAEHRRRCLVIGTNASLELTNAYDDHLLVRSGAPGDPAATAETISVGTEMPLLAELRAFLAHVQGAGPPPKSSARDGLLVVTRIAEIEAELARVAL